MSTTPTPGERAVQPSAWTAPPFLLTSCLVLVGFGVSWGVWTTAVDGLRTARAEDRAAINACLADQSALRLRVNTLETDGAGQQRLWLEKWNTIDTRSQRIESMLEELLRGRSAARTSYR
jgi:hypothetical protein